MATKYYVDENGNYLGGFDGTLPDDPNAVEVLTAPEHGYQVWSGSAWGETPKVVKVRELTRSSSNQKHFHDVNYIVEVLSNLYPKRIFNFGELVKVEWYSDDQLTDLVLTVDVTYTRDALGFATERMTIRTWYNTDDTPNTDVKNTRKVYANNPQDQIKELVRKRDNNVTQININLIGIIPMFTTLTAQDAIDSGREFFSIYRAEKDSYIEEGSLALENAVRDDVDVQFNWMDADATSLGITGVTTIRGYIIYNLSDGVRTS